MTSSSAPAQQKLVVFFGDSLTAGFNLDPMDAYPALIQKKVENRKWPFKVVNAGLSGDTTSSGLRRLDWVLKQKPDVLLLELGANDGLRGIPLNEMRNNLQQIIDKINRTYPDTLIVVLGMRLPPNMGRDYTQDFHKVFIDLALKNKLPSIPFFLDGVAGDPELNLGDGIHPTAEGHKIMAENVWKVLEPLLKRLL